MGSLRLADGHFPNLCNKRGRNGQNQESNVDTKWLRFPSGKQGRTGVSKVRSRGRRQSRWLRRRMSTRPREECFPTSFPGREFFIRWLLEDLESSCDNPASVSLPYISSFILYLYFFPFTCFLSLINWWLFLLIWLDIFISLIFTLWFIFLQALEAAPLRRLLQSWPQVARKELVAFKAPWCLVILVVQRRHPVTSWMIGCIKLGEKDLDHGDYRERGSLNQIFQGVYKHFQRIVLSGDPFGRSATAMQAKMVAPWIGYPRVGSFLLLLTRVQSFPHWP